MRVKRGDIYMGRNSHPTDSGFPPLPPWIRASLFFFINIMTHNNNDRFKPTISPSDARFDTLRKRMADADKGIMPADNPMLAAKKKDLTKMRREDWAFTQFGLFSFTGRYYKDVLAAHHSFLQAEPIFFNLFTMGQVTRIPMIRAVNQSHRLHIISSAIPGLTGKHFTTWSQYEHGVFFLLDSQGWTIIKWRWNSFQEW